MYVRTSGRRQYRGPAEYVLLLPNYRSTAYVPAVELLPVQLAATREMRGSSDASTDSSDDADDDDGGTQDNRFAPNAIARRVSDSAALRCDDLPDDYRSTEYQGARRRHSDADLPSLNARPSARVYVNSDDECDDEEGSDCDDDDAQQAA